MPFDAHGADHLPRLYGGRDIAKGCDPAQVSLGDVLQFDHDGTFRLRAGEHGRTGSLVVTALRVVRTYAHRAGGVDDTALLDRSSLYQAQILSSFLHRGGGTAPAQS